MYRMILIRPGQPMQCRTGETPADVQRAYVDLLTSQGIGVIGAHTVRLKALMADSRARGSAALKFGGGISLVLHTER
ncbi:hypothetical protein [Streptomyces sp. NRRL B-1347]|uniref:hypothetical protein n=1 Tax=Streptomyces sp. NRRL B-1347 TaxID=1476877 RepID=UPI0004C86738|nr:hypothetical protein [Streptomyces sp. NRRL B-1347]